MPLKFLTVNQFKILYMKDWSNNFIKYLRIKLKQDPLLTWEHPINSCCLCDKVSWNLLCDACIAWYTNNNINTSMMIIKLIKETLQSYLTGITHSSFCCGFLETISWYSHPSSTRGFLEFAPERILGSNCLPGDINEHSLSSILFAESNYQLWWTSLTLSSYNNLCHQSCKL